MIQKKIKELSENYKHFIYEMFTKSKFTFVELGVVELLKKIEMTKLNFIFVLQLKGTNT